MSDRLRVVKFSGGRSSGMMTLRELPKMKPERGDCVIFCNTSAEHPATYDFVARMREEVEGHGIPMFILEYQTREVEKRGHWTRRDTFRLAGVDNMKMRGEIFEEMLCTKTITPSIQRRFCTEKMKLAVDAAFMQHWARRDLTLPMQGNRRPKADAESIYAAYVAHGGRHPKRDFFRRVEFLLKCPSFRPKQSVQEFTSVPLTDACQADDWTSLVGYRADEPRRVAKMRERNARFADADGEWCQAPLADAGITKRRVMEFWARQDFDLGIDSELGNCVYCFFKFPTQSKSLPRALKDIPPELKGTPADINWWVRMEDKYSSRSIDSMQGDGDEKPLGFFMRNSGISYLKIKNGEVRQPADKSALPQLNFPEPCWCTD